MTRFAQLWRHTPTLVLAAAILLLLAGVAGAIFSERDFREQKIEQAEAHARVLAASVSAALAFQDVSEAELAIDALAANPDIDAVGVYAADGSLFAERVGPAGIAPRELDALVIRQYDAGHAEVSAPVLQNATPLGSVYVRLSAGYGAARWLRYVGIALLTVMGALLFVVVSGAQRALSNANAELSRRAHELTAINKQLSGEVEERHKAESALAQAQKMEAIGQLTGGVAHDFNNLLMVISSGLRLLETRDDEAKRASIVAAMRQAVDRGAGLTKQLLAFSRRQPLTPEIVVVQERLDGLRSLLERSLREDISIAFDFAGADAVVKIDAGQFDLAVLNMAVNARDAMPQGGRLTVRVRSQAGAAGDEVKISVVDTGTGMAPEVVSRAFDPFFTTKDVGKGTGLGLSQVYGFALQSGGRCDIESQQGVGTSVNITLPCTTERAPARVAPAPEQIVTGAGTVLVVEDDDNVAAMVCEMIADLGYDPVRVANARDALGHLEAGRKPDLVFSDIIMPGGMSGLDLAREVRHRYPELPLLLTTGYSGKGETEFRGFDVLRKPYDRDALGAALASVRAIPKSSVSA